MWTNYSDYYTLDPFPDELFHSTVARTVALIGSKHYYDTMHRYFNHHRASPTAVLPVGKFPDPVLVYYHGMAPYHMSTYSLNRQKILLNRIFTNGNFTGAFKNGATSEFLKKPRLSYCPCCLKEDRKKFGMPYFHVVHQFGGITACPHHGTRLVEYSPNDYCSTLPVLKPEDYVEPEIAKPREQLYSKWALGFKDLSHEYLSLVYQNMALERDIDLFTKKRLYDQLEQFFGYDFLSKVDCSKERLRYGNEKILFLITYNTRSVHPFYHFMLWEFLGLSLENFKNSVFAVHPKNKFFPVPKPKNLENLPVKSEGLGCTIYKTEDSFGELYEFYPIDVGKFVRSLL